MLKDASCTGLARYMQRAFWHQGATLTKSRRNTCQDVVWPGNLAQDFDLQLDCPSLMGNV
jgi:hypothetical protein